MAHALSPSSRRQTAACSLLLALLVAGCGAGGNKAASQVAVKVNDSEVTAHQVELLSQRELAARPADQAAAINRQVLDGLVEQELAAQAARKEGLESTPRVVQLVEIAKREVLARAWQDKVSEQARGPSSDEIDRYYEEHPALFAQRKIYALTETVVEVDDGANTATLKARIEAADSLAKLAEALASDGVRSTARNLRATAEELPLAMLDKVAALRDGQSLAVPRDGGLRVLTVVSTQLAKVDRTAAKPLIQSFLTNERKLALIQEQMAVLRQKATIDYRGAYAAPSSAPSASAPR